MASKVAALVRNFLQTDADALYLVAGEKIFITRGTARAVAGREVVSAELFQAVVDELVPGVPPETLVQKRSSLPYVAGPGLAPVEIRFALVNGASAMMFVREARGSGVGGPRTPVPPRRTPTPVPAPSEVLEAPASLVEPVPAPVEVPLPAGPASPLPGPGRGAVVTLLSFARGMGASDAFLCPAERPLFRVRGSLVAAGPAAPGGEDVDAFLSATAPARAAAGVLRSGFARYVFEAEGAGRCLVRVARSRNGTSLTVRLLPPRALPLDALGLPGSVSRLGAPGSGLVLVAGAPGSGRTTTLAALAAHAAQERGERVLTFEDPVELPIPPGTGSVSPREAGSDVPSMRAGLCSAAAEDADVVLVGEIPDAASAALVVELAASGRLVLSAVPAPSLGLALQWLVARFPDGRRPELRALLAAVLRGGVALALCRGLRGGLVAAAETLHPGSLVSDLILGGNLATLPEHLRDATGYVSLNGSLEALVTSGLVDPTEALLRSLDGPALLSRLREAGAKLPSEAPGGGGGGSRTA
jgi:Tfp pilus assembly pilus retraction ATPase PilT